MAGRPRSRGRDDSSGAGRHLGTPENEAEGSPGIKQIFTSVREVPRVLEGVGVGLWEARGLAVPSESVEDFVQVSAQEYRERHEAELWRKETLSERSRGCRREGARGAGGSPEGEK